MLNRESNLDLSKKYKKYQDKLFEAQSGGESRQKIDLYNQKVKMYKSLLQQRGGNVDDKVTQAQDAANRALVAAQQAIQGAEIGVDNGELGKRLNAVAANYKGLATNYVTTKQNLADTNQSAIAFATKVSSDAGTVSRQLPQGKISGDILAYLDQLGRVNPDAPDFNPASITQYQPATAAAAAPPEQGGDE